MGYIKTIIYGNTLELYNYEKDINTITLRRSRKTVQIPSLLPCLDSHTKPHRQPDIQRQIQKRHDNLNRAGMAFIRIVRANLCESDPPLFVTVQYHENISDVEQGYKDYNAFISNLRYRFGKDFRYIAVPEFQKRGALHFHALFWGLPPDLYLKERSTRLVASIWGRGFVDIALTDGNEKIAGYLGKYMRKSYADNRLLGKKVYRCSRNIIRPVVDKNPPGFLYIENKYDLSLSVDNSPLQDKSFQSKWLGKGRIRYYKINQQKK